MEMVQPLMGGGTSAPPAYPFHGKSDWSAKQAQEREIAKVVYVGQQGSLLIERTLEHLVGLQSGGFGVGMLCKKSHERLVLILESVTHAVDGMHQIAAMQLFVADQHGVHHSDPNAAAHVAHQVVET